MAASKVDVTHDTATAWCVTQPKHQLFRFSWRILQFARYMQLKPSMVLKSSAFKIRSPIGAEWRLHLYPNGVDPEWDGFVSCYVHLVSAELPELAATLTLYLIDANGTQYFVRDSPSLHTFSYVTVNQACWGIPDLAPADEIYDMHRTILPGGSLTIVCECCMRGFTTLWCGTGSKPDIKLSRTRLSSSKALLQKGREWTKKRRRKSKRRASSISSQMSNDSTGDDSKLSPHRPSPGKDDRPLKASTPKKRTPSTTRLDPKVVVPPGRLREDMALLLQHGPFSDMKVTVAKGQVIQVHKTVLKARCPKMLEKAVEGVVDQPDVPAEVMRQFLRFVYTGWPGDINPSDKMLFEVARRFEMDRLAAICEAAMVSDLDIYSVTGYFSMTRDGTLPELRKEAVVMLRNTILEMDGKDWEHLEKENPQVLHELLSLAYPELQNPEAAATHPDIASLKEKREKLEDLYRKSSSRAGSRIADQMGLDARQSSVERTQRKGRSSLRRVSLASQQGQQEEALPIIPRAPSHLAIEDLPLPSLRHSATRLPLLKGSQQGLPRTQSRMAPDNPDTSKAGGGSGKKCHCSHKPKEEQEGRTGNEERHRCGCVKKEKAKEEQDEEGKRQEEIRKCECLQKENKAKEDQDREEEDRLRQEERRRQEPLDRQKQALKEEMRKQADAYRQEHK